MTDKNQSANKQLLRDSAAHLSGDLKYLLRPWLQFRVYVQFRNGKKVHFYGNEHQCTYQQLMHGHIENIRLDREKGYTDLIDWIERDIRGRYISAKIYMRSDRNAKFDTLCRHYNSKCELQDCQDPVIPEEEKVLILFHYTKAGRLVITETDPAAEDFKINL